MARSQKAEVVITCNASQAKQMIEMLRAKAEQLRQTYAKRVAEYKKLLAQSGKETDKTRALRKEINALERQFKTLDSAEKHNLQELGDINKILKNLSGATTRQLRSALSTLKKELENTSGGEIQRQKQLQMQMKAVQKQIDKNTGAVSRHGNAWKTSIRNIGTYLGMFTLVSTAISKLGDVFRKNLDMSDQLSQIRMVSGLSMRMVDKLSERLRQVDTRSTLTDLQQIAYEGSKLGFGKYGVEGLAGFTEAANQVNVALKEQMGEDTLPMMSKMVENMGLIKKMGIEKALLSTGSAMFRLSASSTSSANNIMEFAKRLAGLASVSKITTPQLLALGSASDSMMLMPEVASTAFNKIITHLQTQPQTIAKALKIPKDTLKDMLSAGKTMDALLLIFQRMHDMGNMNALGGIFKPLGSDGARLNAVAVSMAKHVDMLREHVKTATDAFIDGQDVTKEYNLRQETANGLMERANNLWAKAFVNKDGVDSVKELALQWYNLSKEMTSSQGVMTSLRLTFELLIFDAKLILRFLPQIILFFSTYGIIRGIQAAVVAITELRASMLAAKTAQEGLNIAMKSNVFGAIAALVVTVVGTIYAYASAASSAAEQQRGLNDAVRDYKVQAKAAEIEVRRHYNAIIQAKKGTQERTAAIKEFNKIYGGYLNHLLSETSSAKDLADAYRAVVKQLQNKIALEARDKEMKRVVQPRIQWSADKLENYDNSIQGSSHSGQTGSWLEGFGEDHQNLGMRSLANLLRRHGGYRITNKQFEQALSRRSSATYGMDPDAKLHGAGAYARMYDPANHAEAVRFWNALAFLSQQRSTTNATTRITNKFKPFITNEDISEDDTPAGTFNNDKTEDKLAAKAAAKAERERLKKERAARAKARKAANEELKIAENNATAIISNIEAYYNLQEAALNDMVKDGRRTTAEVTSLVADLKIRRNKALANARFALSGQKNDFEKIRQEMGRGYDMFTHPDKDGNDRSSDLLKSIQSIDVGKAYKTLAKFDGSDKVYGISAKSFLDEINKNGTKNLEENSEIEKKRAEAIDSVMRSYNEISNLYKDTADNFVTLGLEVQNFADAAQVEYPHTGPDTPVNANDKPITQVGKEGYATEGSKLAGDHALNGVTVTAPKGVRQHPFDAMLASFIGDGYRPYVGDISTDKGMYEWLSGFLSNYTSDEEGNPQMAAWAKQLNLTHDFANQIDDAAIRDNSGNIDPEKLKKQLDPIRKNVQLFYYELMKFGDAYYEKLKSDSDKQKKIIGEMWNRSNEYRQYSNADRALSRMSDREGIYGRRQNDWQPFGFSKTVRGDDVEMAEKRNNLWAAQVQYQMAKLKTTDPKVLNDYLDKIDKAQNELEKTVATRVTDRMSELKQWTDPIEQLGTAMGKAFAMMSDSAKAGRDAVKEALADMVRAYAQSTVKIINELMLRKVKEELIRKAAKKGKKSGFETELFNDNGTPTGTIENANIVIANSNLSTPAPTATTGAANGTTGNNENGTTTAMTPEEGVKAGAAGAEEGRRAAERVSQELGNGNTDATSVIGSAIGGAAGDALGGLSSKVQQKVAENKAIEKENKKHNEKIEKQNKDSDKKVKKQESDSGKARAQMKREHNKQILGAETALAAGQQTVTGTMTAIQNKAQQEQDTANTNSTVKNATTDTEGGIVSGAAKIIAKLGWWGIPLVAVITALLNGLLSAFLSKLGKSNSSTSSGTNTKLKTGMLTYDEGNVQQYRGLLDGQSYPVVGDDGRVYAATSVSQAVTGIVRSPIATMINGQPSLVAERGPEMVIGRETTAAMMMNRPDLLREIIMYDKNRSSMPYRTYDAGNVQQVAAVSGATGVDNDTKAIMGALSVAITSLVDRLNKPFEARMDPYGRGGALDALNKAQQFMNKHK